MNENRFLLFSSQTATFDGKQRLRGPRCRSVHTVSLHARRLNRNIVDQALSCCMRSQISILLWLKAEFTSYCILGCVATSRFLSTAYERGDHAALLSLCVQGETQSTHRS